MFLLHALTATAHGCHADWTCEKTWTSGTNDLIGVGASVRAVGGDETVFIALELMDPSGIPSTWEHSLWLRKQVWNGFLWVTTPPADLGVTLGNNQFIQSSMTRKDDGTELYLLYRAAPGSGCSSTDYSLEELVWDVGARGVDATNVVDDACDDHDFPWSHESNGSHVATFTMKGASDNGNSSARTATSWSLPSVVDTDASDHAQITQAGNKIAVYHAEPSTGNDHRIRVKIGPNAVVELGSTNNLLNYPTVTRTGDLLWVLAANSSTGVISERSCDTTTDDCLDAGDWTGPTDGPTGQHLGTMRWLQVREAPNGRQFLIWEEGYSASETRVQFSERCPGESWEDPIDIRPPTNGKLIETLLSGQPSIAVDGVNGQVHVVWAAVDSATPDSITEGDIWWAYKDYGSCM